jgi:hypothetical protein
MGEVCGFCRSANGPFIGVQGLFEVGTLSCAKLDGRLYADIGS